ncbi:hypothetical protein [Paenibacillus polymyxa]|uniref:hypothetical protein n=1 Tax=Paenibacillus polymyxa TaxID=1406 RepID=UPI0039916A45
MLFLVGINTGLRISHILHFKVGSVKGTYIFIQEKKTKKKKNIPIRRALLKELVCGESGLKVNLPVENRIHLFR